MARTVQEHQSAFPDRTIEVTSAGVLDGEWDGDRLAQLVSNLIGNALQYGEGAERIQVRLDGTQAGAVTLTVINAGRIAPEVLPYIFDPFHRGDSLAGRSEGLGLGLYIAQQIAHAHQGTIDVDSTSTSHTAFSVTIPRRAGAAAKL
jgi:signal transduction histidine kinase